MERRRHTYWTWALSGLVLGVIACTPLLTYWNLTRAGSMPRLDDGLTSVSLQALTFIVFVIVGGLILANQPGNAFGWAWMAFSLIWGCLMPLVTEIGYFILAEYPQLPVLAFWVATLADLVWFLAVCIFPLILLLFPTGRFLSPRWRLVGWTVCLTYLAAVSAHWAAPQQRGSLPIANPYDLGAIGQVAGWIENLGLLVGLGCIFLGILSLLVRFTRSKGVERQQMKWFAFRAGLFGVLLVIELTLPALPGAWEDVKEALMLIIFPVTVGIAILRYHLFEIDRIIRRTLVYGALTAMLFTVFLGCVTLLQALFARTSGQRSSLAIVLSTLVIAALFNPLRRQLQGFIDRRFYRQKYNAENVLAAFAAAAQMETDLEALMVELVQVAQETIQPETISLWLPLKPGRKD